MSFNSTLLAALETNKTPLILNQLIIPQPWLKFIVDSAGIYKFSTLTNVYLGIDPEITENFPLLDTIGIGAVVVDGVSLTEITSYTNTIDGRAAALAAGPGFIFDGLKYQPKIFLQVSRHLSDQDFVEFPWFYP